MYEFLWRCIFRHALVWENGEAMERKMHSYAAAAQLVCQQGSQSPQSLPSCPCINRQHMQQAASPQPAEDMKAVAGLAHSFAVQHHHRQKGALMILLAST